MSSDAANPRVFSADRAANRSINSPLIVRASYCKRGGLPSASFGVQTCAPCAPLNRVGQEIRLARDVQAERIVVEVADKKEFRDVAVWPQTGVGRPQALLRPWQSPSVSTLFTHIYIHPGYPTRHPASPVVCYVLRKSWGNSCIFQEG